MKPGAVDRFRHRIRPGELVPHSLRPVCSCIRFRRDAGEGFEDPMEVKAAHAGGRSEPIEVRHVLSGLNETASLDYRSSVLCGERRFSRSASSTGPEACLFGLCTRRMETDMRTACQARRAGWPTIDASRSHRIIERTVSGAVTPYHRRPPFLVTGERRCGLNGYCPREFTRLLHSFSPYKTYPKGYDMQTPLHW
jgi:hypothetical protein